MFTSGRGGLSPLSAALGALVALVLLGGLLVLPAGAGASPGAPVPVESEGQPAVQSAATSDLKMVAIGDSFTAGFGYYADGDWMSIRQLPKCMPGDILDDACSSNSRNYYSDTGEIQYSEDFGYDNQVSWTAQLAKKLGIRKENYTNLAVTGSTASQWAKSRTGQRPPEKDAFRFRSAMGLRENCMDANANGSMILYHCISGNPNQKIEMTSNGSMKIRGKCLSALYVNTNNSPLRLENCAMGDAVRIVSDLPGRRCMDAARQGVTADNGAWLVLWGCKKSGITNNQNALIDPNSRSVEIGTKCFDAEGERDSVGTNVVLWKCDPNKRNQRVTYDPATKRFSLMGKCLGVDRDADDSRIVLQACSGSLAQRWSLEPAERQKVTYTDRGELRIHDKCIDARGEANKDGTVLVQWDCEGKPNQTWERSPYWVPPDGKTEELFLPQYGGKAALQVAAEMQPDIVAMTMGGNPTLSDFLFDLSQPCLFTLGDESFKNCVAKLVERAETKDSLVKVYNYLLERTSAKLVVHLYPQIVPGAMTNVTRAEKLLLAGEVINEAVTAAIEKVEAAYPGEDRIAQVNTTFNVGIPPGDYVQWHNELRTIQCVGAAWLVFRGVDGPSQQSELTSTEFRWTRGFPTPNPFPPFIPLLIGDGTGYCGGGETRVISSDTGIHPNVAGYAAFADSAEKELKKRWGTSSPAALSFVNDVNGQNLYSAEERIRATIGSRVRIRFEYLGERDDLEVALIREPDCYVGADSKKQARRDCRGKAKGQKYIGEVATRTVTDKARRIGFDAPTRAGLYTLKLTLGDYDESSDYLDRYLSLRVTAKGKARGRG